MKTPDHNSKSNLEPLTAEQRWDVERYLLGDATLDSEAFEAQMLDDPRLAYEVSAAVDRLANLEAACSLEVGVLSGVERQTQVSSEKQPSSWFLGLSSSRFSQAQVVVCVLAASLLLVVTIRFASTDRAAQSPELATQDKQVLTEVADRWLAFSDVSFSDVGFSDSGLNDTVVSDTNSFDSSLGEGTEAIFVETVIGETVIGGQARGVGGLSSESVQSDETDWLLKAAEQFFLEARSEEDSNV